MIPRSDFVSCRHDGPQDVFLADDADEAAAVQDRKRVDVVVDHEGCDVLQACIGVDGDRVHRHGPGDGCGYDLFHFLLQAPVGGQRNEAVKKGEQGGQGEPFLLDDEIVLADDPDELAPVVDDGQPVEVILQEELCRLRDLRVGCDGDHVLRHDVPGPEHGPFPPLSWFREQVIDHSLSSSAMECR